MGWLVELSQYKIYYLLQAAIKRQVVTYFIAELTPSKENKVQPDLNSSFGEIPEELRPTPTWTYR